MIKRQALLLSIVALTACGGNTATAPAPATPAAPPDPPHAHQSEQKPVLPGKLATPGNHGSAKSTKLTFDMPQTWSQAPESLVRKPWKMGFINPDLLALVLMDFEVKPHADAREQVGRIINMMCNDEQGWNCSPSQALPDGTGAVFSFTTAKTKGRVAVRDLDGSGRCQVQLFGQWAKDKDQQASKDFEVMVSSAKVE